MKSQIENMEMQIDVLSQKTTEITSNVIKVDETLAEKKKKIQKFTNAQSAINKLNFIFDLPKKLRSNMNRNQIAKSIIYSSRASKLLKKYTHLSAFQKIEKECEVISQEIANIVKKKLQDSVFIYN